MGGGRWNLKQAIAVADGAGGAWIAWLLYDGINDSIVANRVSPGGSRLVLGGFTLGTSSNILDASLDIDGAGGAIVAWFDQTRHDVYANRADLASGSGKWNGANGIVVCNSIRVGGNDIDDALAEGSAAARGMAAAGMKRIRNCVPSVESQKPSTIASDSTLR